MLPLQRGTSVEGLIQCPSCSIAFPLQKTLNRHMRTVHRSCHPFKCMFCDRRFPRKDTLDRHINTQHSAEGEPVRCKFCLKEVRPRCLPSHWSSQACRRMRSAVVQERDIQFSFESRLYHTSASPTNTTLPEITEAATLGAWLFVKIRGWGPGEYTLNRWLLTPTSASVEIIQLMGSLYRTLYKELSSGRSCRESHYLMDAMIMLCSCSGMIHGFKASADHVPGITELAAIQAEAQSSLPGGREAFLNQPPSHAFQDVLLRAVNTTDMKETEVTMCLRLMTSLTSFIRLMAYDLVYRPVKHQDQCLKVRSQLWGYDDYIERYSDEIVGLANAALSIETTSDASYSQLTAPNTSTSRPCA